MSLEGSPVTRLSLRFEHKESYYTGREFYYYTLPDPEKKLIRLEGDQLSELEKGSRHFVMARTVDNLGKPTGIMPVFTCAEGIREFMKMDC